MAPIANGERVVTQADLAQDPNTVEVAVPEALSEVPKSVSRDPAVIGLRS